MMRPQAKRAWQVLELGPQWQSRRPEQRGVASAVVAVPSSSIEGEPVERGGPGPVVVDQPVVARVALPHDLVALRDQVSGCMACPLAATRRQTVFGIGPIEARCMIIGEAPGEEEDARGEPFIGKAGQLLDRMLSEIGLGRSIDVYITNVVKCRPPGNRNPAPEEMAACAAFLARQVELVRPKVLLLLGRFAIQSMLRTDASVGSLRGRVHHLSAGGREVPAIVSYHPAYLLRNPPEKRKSWDDLLLLAELIDRTPADPAS